MNTYVGTDKEMEFASRGLARPIAPRRFWSVRPSDSLRRDPREAGRGQIVPFVGLRGIMALNVSLRHIWAPDNGAVAMALLPFKHGLVGHEFFFVLSGFGLTLSMIRREETGRFPRLGQYLSDRWRKLAPPYYAALLLVLLLSLPKSILGYPYGPRIGLGDVIAHITFVHGMWQTTSTSMLLWSISTIFQFYLVFPLLYALVRKLDYRLAVAAVALSWLAFRASISVATLGEALYLNGTILNRVFPFAAGMGVAQWYAMRHRKTAVSARVSCAWALALLGAAMALQNTSLLAWIDLPYGLGYAALLVGTVVSADRGGRLGRLLSHPLLVWLGSISYSLYLTHSFVFLITRFVLVRIMGLGTGLAYDALAVGSSLTLALVFAWGFHRLVERPLRPNHQTV